MQHHESLPSLDEVAASDKNDSSRFPIYREARIHPYCSIPVLVNEDCLLNTVYDDERVISNDPPLPARPDDTPPPQPQAVDEFEERLRNEEDYLLNTIYEDERVSDPPLPAQPDVTPPLQPQVIDEFEDRLRQSMERVIAFELRVQRLPTVIVEFVAGVTRATRE